MQWETKTIGTKSPEISFVENSTPFSNEFEDIYFSRVDGIQEYSDTTYDQLAIGGQIGLFQNAFANGNYLAGNLYSCILRAAESTDKEIASTESYVAKKTGLLAQVDGPATLSLDFGGNTYTARNSNGGIL